MVDQLEAAREAVQQASEAVDDPRLREQLRSIDEGLMEQTEAAKTEADEPRGDQLEAVEAELARLMDAVDEVERAYASLEVARDAIDEYRREYTRDW